jgi:tetratricopeptide (TPR) repeat protein
MATDRTTIDAQVLYDRGHESFQTGDYREAVECFTRAIRLRPNVAAGYRYRALAYLEMGQRVDALNDLDQAIRLRSDDPMLYADRARVLFRQRSYPAAIADCTRALELDDGLAPLYGLRGECHAANGDTRSAFADYAVALAQDPDHAADYLLARTELHLELEDPESALADGEEAIRRSPENPNGYQARGMAYRMLGQFTDADADFTKVLELDANRPLTRLARATVRLGVRNYAGAAADCDAVIAVLPATGKAFELRGLCRKYLGDDAGAIADYTEAIRLNPTNPIAYNLRAGLHYHRHRYTKAIQDHLDALKRDPKSASTFNQLGWIWATAPDPDVRNGARAKECATRACELTEWQESSYLDTLAAACAEVGDFDAAVKWMEKALALAPTESEDDYHSRLALYRQEKPVRVTPEG